jgi:hypothetical protein
MITVGRYACFVVILIVTSLTPSSCTDLAEEAMAYEQAEGLAADGLADRVAAERVVLDHDVLHRTVQKMDVKPNAASESDADQTGS